MSMYFLIALVNDNGSLTIYVSKTKVMYNYTVIHCFGLWDIFSNNLPKSYHFLFWLDRTLFSLINYKEAGILRSFIP